MILSANELFHILRNSPEGDELLVMFRNEQFVVQSVSRDVEEDGPGQRTILWIVPDLGRE